ncbi:transcriptional regulator family: Fungal Specific TF [Penicillium sp. IBT 18751x]|nr:transcriptional regulator family: Fungal Specific TF [Penicillium sp. IBT 18751x]
MDSPAVVRRQRRRRVADENRKRSIRAQRSPKPPEVAQASPCSAHRSMVTPTNPCDTRREDAPVNRNGEDFSPSSVLSQGLAKHVIADHSKKVPWPDILSRLREAFSLDPQAASEERDMVAMQARMTCPKALHPFELLRSQEAIDAFPPRPVADFLFSVFTKHATDTFFYFDQAQFLSDLDQFYSDVTSPLRFDAAFICLAMATFALASQWTPMERPERSDIGEQRSNTNLGRIFYFHAKNLIPDIIERNCLRSIQAPFVLGVYLLPASAVGSSYVYMGLALRKALASDLHLHSDDQGLDYRETEVRRRLWWSIYSLESLLEAYSSSSPRCTTIKLNRPRSVSADIITVPTPAPYAPLDRSQIFNNIDCQIAYTRLVKVLDQIADIGTFEQTDTSYVQWEASLKEWKSSLPSDFTLDQIDSRTSKYRTVLHLRLNYYYAWITMGKVALVTVARAHMRRELYPGTATSNLCDRVRKQAKACTKAARKILQLFESLTQAQKITRFSFTDFQGCSIATIVTLVAGIMGRDSGYHSRVAFGLNCLKQMATGNMTAKMGVKFVQAIQSITTEAVDKLTRATSHEHRSGYDSETSVTLAYNQWDEWLTQQERSSSGTASMQPVPFECLESTIGGLSSWQSQVEQLGPSNSFVPKDSTECPTVSGSLNHEESGAFSALYADEQTLLMGLTGIDALDFSDLTGHL